MPEFVKIKNKKLRFPLLLILKQLTGRREKKLYKSKNDWEFKFFFLKKNNDKISKIL